MRRAAAKTRGASASYRAVAMGVQRENNRNEGRGFSGISSLVSDVEMPKEAAPEAKSSGDTAHSFNVAQRSQKATQRPATEQESATRPRQTSDSSGGKWFIAIVVFLGLLWIIGNSADKTRSRPTSYSPTAQTTTNYSTPQVQAQRSTRPTEVKPAVGQNLVHTHSELRYCLAEGLRIDGARSAANSNADISRFNAMVSDYNSRCGSFRYRSGALESARRDVEPHRDQLLAEGASRFLPSAPVGATSSKASSRIPSKQTVQAIQSRLNALGYDAGPADGLMGRMTRAAILEFQRDAGLRGDGIASEELLNWLKTSSAN